VSITKRYAVAATPFVVALIWWLGGYDFDERNHLAATFAICAILTTAFVWEFPEK
jgi:hypothetical protein